MFTKITMKNVKGIKGLIELDFVAPPKKKDKKDSVVILEPNVSINKIAGIIGPNASGKSSIIRTLADLRIFLCQYKFIEYAKEQKDEELQKILLEHRLPERNFENLEENSFIKLDLYIPNGEIVGYYTYELEYNDDILYERLFYRKKFDSKKIYEIENYMSNEQRSDIGYKYYNKDSIIEDYKNVSPKLKQAFEEKIKYYKTFYDYYVNESSCISVSQDIDYIEKKEIIKFIIENKKIAQKLLNLIDNKIKDIEIKKDIDGKRLIKFITYTDTELDIWNLSTGTIRMLKLIITIIRTITNQAVMLCDEIETALHKELVQLIINIYIKNNSMGQLIYTTHIPEILDQKEMRNDQKFYLTSRNGEIIVKKVSEINPRADYSISKNYYTDSNYAPQPTKKDIDEFCEYVIKSK